MATKRDTDLFQALPAAGLRKKVAHAVTDATRTTKPGKQSKLLVPWNRSVNAVPLERPMCSTPSRRELISHSCYRYSGQMCHNKQKWSHHERHEEGPLDIVSGRYIGRRY